MFVAEPNLSAPPTPPCYHFLYFIEVLLLLAMNFFFHFGLNFYLKKKNWKRKEKTQIQLRETTATTVVLQFV